MEKSRNCYQVMVSLFCTKLHPALWTTVDVNQASLSNSLVIALQQNNQIIL